MGITPIYSIPFAEPTDLVRDWPDLSEDVAEAVEAAIAGVPVLAGIGSNVVSTTKTNTFTASVGVGALSSDVTGLTVTITPTSATSKVLVIASLSVNVTSTSRSVVATLFRDGSAVAGYTGDADGSRRRVSTSSGRTDGEAMANQSLLFVDEPNTTDPVVYSVRLGHNDGTSTQTVTLNIAQIDTNASNVPRAASTLTAIEVAA